MHFLLLQVVGAQKRGILQSVVSHKNPFEFKLGSRFGRIDPLIKFWCLIYMSLALTNLSWWLLGGKQKEPKLQNGTCLNPATELNLWDSETRKFSLSFGGSSNRASKPRRVKKKLHGRQEQQTIDREHDVVVVPSDGGCISDSDSDASDWSIGWSEPHAAGFLSDDENDCGFGVLVPCYGSKNRDDEGKSEFVEAKSNAADRYFTGRNGKMYMEQWL